MRGMVTTRTRRSAVVFFTVACVIGYLAFVFFPTLYVVMESESLDFASYYYGLQTTLDAGNPYDLQALTERAHADGFTNPVYPFFYPPPTLLLFMPAALGTLREATIGMYLLNNLLLASTGYALWVFHGKRRFLVPVMAFVLLSFAPIQMNNQWGQVNLCALLLIVLGLACIRRESDLSGGILLGAAAMMKISPALFIVWMAYRRRFRVVAGAVVCAGLLTLISLPLVRPGVQLYFYSQVLPEFRAGGNYSGLSISLRSIGIHSLPRLWYLVFPNPDSRSVLSPSAAVASTISALGLIILIGLAVRARRVARGAQDQVFALQAGAVMVLMVILPVYSYDHHLVFLLLPIFALAVAVESRSLVVRWYLPLTIAYLCLAMPRSVPEAAYDMTRPMQGPLGSLLRGAILEARLAAACIVLAGCLAAARHASHSPTETS